MAFLLFHFCLRATYFIIYTEQIMPKKTVLSVYMTETVVLKHGNAF